MRIIVSLILLAVLGGVGWYLFSNATPETTGTPPPAGNISDARGAVAPAETPLVVDKTVSSTFLAERLTAKATYPAIVLPRHKTEETRANDVLRAAALRVIESFREEAGAANAEIPISDETLGNDIAIGYDTLFLSPTLISFRYNISTYTIGAAHPNNETLVVNYDIARHVILATDDLFLPDADILGILASTSRRELLADCTDCDEGERAMIVSGTEPKKEYFTRVGLKPGGLSVMFDPYQVAPYARGVREVFIPLTEIGEILKSEVKAAIGDASSGTNGNQTDDT